MGSVWLFRRHKGRLPEIRLVVLRLRDRLGRQRTHNARDHPPLRGGLGQVLWKRASSLVVRARSKT